MSAAALRAWLRANPRAPRAWRELAERAVTAGDSDLWPAGVDPMPLYVAARDALRQASTETSRLTDEEETAALDDVARAIDALRQAIERAPLPRWEATMCILNGGRLPDAELLIGWRDMPENMLAGAYSTSVTDMLRVADELLRKHRAALPPRAVKRHRDRPAAVAFVRWMDFFSHRMELATKPKTVAAWCGVALGETLTARDVRTILRDTAEELKPRNRPR